MCGIIGQVSANRIADEVVFDRMRDTLTHRGPDHGATYRNAANTAALGHRRLSILDLSAAGHQPMTNHNGSLWLTYNGEVYNAPSLREELVALGYTFRSRTDSEVLLHGYAAWGGVGLLKRIKGMFAFGIWDDRREELFAARDRFGIKPLVYRHTGGQFTFASEIKALLADPSHAAELLPEAIADFFAYSYVPTPTSCWRGLHKLPPAHYLTYRPVSDELSIQRYWRLAMGDAQLSTEVATATFAERLNTATKAHLLADVPTGLFLSGGYDSSALLLAMQETGITPRCFTVGWGDHFRSEHRQAAYVADLRGAPLQLSSITADRDLLSDLRALVAYYDEPYAISGMLSYDFVSRLAADHRYKVVLAGDGGDEALLGYKWHYAAKRWYDRSGWQRVKDAFALRRPPAASLLDDYESRMSGVRTAAMQHEFLAPALARLLRERGRWYYEDNLPADQPPARALQWLDTHTFLLDACLQRADQSSMRHSLEVRVPFQDHELFEYTFSLAPNVLLQPPAKKVLLERYLRQYLPDRFFAAPKKGFSFAHFDALVARPPVEDLLVGGRSVRLGFVSETARPAALPPNLTWHWLMLELFLERFDL